jgi:hypothetical protein
MENQYNSRHAREILEPCGVLNKYLSIDDRGLWPVIARDLLLQSETELLRWRPARHLQHLPGAPEVNDTPMLPNPFNARELAAFMLDGIGALVADFYGEWDKGLKPECLNRIDPDSKARRALIEAFDAYRLAFEKVGPWEADALARRDAARKAYRKSSNDKALLEAFDEAQAEWDAANQRWLTKMVVCLLEPQAQAAPVMADSASNAPAKDPPPVATGNVAHAFADLRGWTEQQWKDKLGSPPKWLNACIVLRGQRGIREHHWNPVLIGDALVRKELAQQNSVRSRFQTKSQLKDWLEAWKTHEADNYDTQ